MLEKEELQEINAHIRPAGVTDVPLIANLLSEGAKFGSVLPRLEEEIERVIDGFVVLDGPETGKLAACASLEVYDVPRPDLELPGLAELRSVVSLKKGASPLIVAKALRRAKELGISDVYATTDNPGFFISRCGFTMEKGGNEIAWMDLERKTGTIYNGNGISVRKVETEGDIQAIAVLLSQDQENVLPLGEKALRHRINSYYLAVDQTQQIAGCVGAFVYSASIPGGRPRMAEIRGLTVANNYLQKEIQPILLDHCLHKFQAVNVKQAFTTASTGRRNDLISSGYFKDVPGGKQVLWWSGK